MALHHVPTPVVDGSLLPWIGSDFVCAVALGFSATLSRATLRTPDAPTTSGIVASVRTAAGGGGSGISVTIPVGSKSASAAGAIAIVGTETFYLYLHGAPAEAVGLTGFFDLETVDAVPVVATALTSTSRVKRFLSVADVSTANDTLLNELIIGVSAAMQRYMNRQILSQTILAEKHTGDDDLDVLTLKHSPIVVPPAVVLRVNGEVYDAASYDVAAHAGQIHHLTGAFPSGATVRNIEADYTAGFSSVPEDIAMAATKQVAWEFRYSRPGGDWLGKRSTVLDAGTSEYEVGGWATGVKDVMDLYRRAA